MQSVVFLQATFGWEATIAETAEERALPGVRTDVDGEVGLGGVGFIAVVPGALEASVGVSALVLSELEDIFEDTKAASDHCAGEDTWVGMDVFLVLSEVRLELKLLGAAFGANEGPEVHVRLKVDSQV